MAQSFKPKQSKKRKVETKLTDWFTSVSKKAKVAAPAVAAESQPQESHPQEKKTKRQSSEQLKQKIESDN